MKNALYVLQYAKRKKIIPSTIVELCSEGIKQAVMLVSNVNTVFILKIP